MNIRNASILPNGAFFDVFGIAASYMANTAKTLIFSRDNFNSNS